jgi:hypothetical protein
LTAADRRDIEQLVALARVLLGRGLVDEAGELVAVAARIDDEAPVVAEARAEVEEARARRPPPAHAPHPKSAREALRE